MTAAEIEAQSLLDDYADANDSGDVQEIEAALMGIGETDLDILEIIVKQAIKAGRL